MLLKRTCPMCEEITSMEIDMDTIASGNVWRLGTPAYRFYTYGECENCQSVVVDAIKEMGKEG